MARSLVAALLQLALFSAAATATPPLLVPSGATLGSSAEVERSRAVAVDTAALQAVVRGSTLSLNLFDDRTLIVEVSEVLRRPSGVTTILGVIPLEPWSAATLTIASGQVSATITTADAAYGLAPLGTADAKGRPIARAVQLAPGAARRCAMERDEQLIAPGDTVLQERFHNHLTHPGTSGETPVLPAGGPPASGACSCGDDGSTIDVLFLYTALARDAAGGVAALQARVNDAVATTNLAYTNSGVSVGTGAGRLMARVAGLTELAYDEVAPAWLDHLSRLADPDDGFIDNALTLRDSAHADVVCLIVDDTRFFGGAAFYALNLRDAAAQVLNWRGMGSGDLTYAHELGHTYGCAHDRGNSAFALFPYAWGYSFIAGGTLRGTIMSSTGAVVPLFSNPDVTFMGVPAGVGLEQPLPCNNAMAIREARWTIAAWADSGRITDCNGNGVDDSIDIVSHVSQDQNGNCRPDECERRIYVDANNTTSGQDGLSWNTALTNLAEAMVAASLECNSISEIWVADGTYTPLHRDSIPGDRFPTLNLRSGLAIYGGFQGKSRPGGGETSINQRVFAPGGGWGVPPSILSGDIGTLGSDTDNSYTIVTATDCDSTAILDGFTIERAYSDFDGAGIFIMNASPAVTSCKFRNIRGGGYSAAAAYGASSPSFTACQFDNNTAVFSGGALGARDGANVAIYGCFFRNNSAQYGGAVAIFNGSTAHFTQCTFADNSASRGSGAIDCFTNNSIVLEQCTFTGNTASSGSGGAITVHTGCIANILDGMFTGNSCPTGTGGAIWSDGSTTTIHRSTFESNFASPTSAGGGALSAYNNSTLDLTLSAAFSNRAAWGGAIAAADSSVHIARSTFGTNSALAFNGGALDFFNTPATTIVSSVFTDHTCPQAGGAILVSGSDPSPASVTITNCTLWHNHAGNSGGGIAVYAGSLQLRNSILWENDSPESLQDQQVSSFAALAVNYSCIQGLDGSLGGAGNIGADPLLTPGISGADLLPGSPCIDAGNNLLVPPGESEDVRNYGRFVDDPAAPDTGVPGGAGGSAIVDMGAVEQLPMPPVCRADFNGDGVVFPDDLSEFITCFFLQVQFPGFCPLADFNGDGVVFPDDLSEFITTFFLTVQFGC